METNCGLNQKFLMTILCACHRRHRGQKWLFSMKATGALASRFLPRSGREDFADYNANRITIILPRNNLLIWDHGGLGIESSSGSKGILYPLNVPLYLTVTLS